MQTKLSINKSENLPNKVHFWEMDGFVKISKAARNNFGRIIKEYGLSRLTRDLSLDKETIYSLYCIGRKKGAHKINCLLIIARHLNYDLNTLEREIIAYGGSQIAMYEFKFPFTTTPLHIRAVMIHGDGSFRYEPNGRYFQAEWYQSGDKILFMEKLLNKLVRNNQIRSYVKDKKNDVRTISVPSHLVKLVCKSLNLNLTDFHSEEFFFKVSRLPVEFKFQVFLQFVVDEGHLRKDCSTLTVSQKKQNIRKGFMQLLDSLNFKFSKPQNPKHDITIYAENFGIIQRYLEDSLKKYGRFAGFWFKEERFKEMFQIADRRLSRLLVESARIDKEIFGKLKGRREIFSYGDIRSFGRTSRQANKAIRNWKKNGLIERIGFNQFKILNQEI